MHFFQEIIKGGGAPPLAPKSYYVVSPVKKNNQERCSAITNSIIHGS